MRSRHGRVSYRRGFTLTEILIAIAVFALVMALLGLPIWSAFGYVQKASARSDAQRAGTQSAQQLQRELEVASYVFDPPPDGSWVAFVKESANPDEHSRGMALSLDAGQEGSVTLVRYAQMPAFPWAWTYATPAAVNQSWVVMAPDYQGFDAAGNKLPPYSVYYAPFHDSSRVGMTPNPYVVTRFEDPCRNWDDAVTKAMDVRYWLVDQTTGPVNGLYTLAPTITQQSAQEQLTRRLHNKLTGVTPYGESTWDTPRFQVKPHRVPREPLSPLKDSTGKVVPTVMLASYPLWAARSTDVDDVYDAVRKAAGDPDKALSDIYGATTAQVRADFPLYPVDTNPFGYQVQVFDGAGGLVYGISNANSTTPMVTSRHFMDWPRIDRPDWDPANPLWTKADIARQRLEGKLLFAQPMRADQLTTNTNAGENPKATLPIPTPKNAGDYCGWMDGGTYLVTPPRKITLRNGAVTKTFTFVTSAAQLGAGKCWCPNLGAFNDTSRVVEFGEPLANGVWDVVRADTGAASTVTYTICDLQPTDTVVVTYSTKAVLELALTVSRKDNAATTPETSRQDFTVNTTIEARNAVKRARGEE